jgi:hypothetical protein
MVRSVTLWHRRGTARLAPPEPGDRAVSIPQPIPMRDSRPSWPAESPAATGAAALLEDGIGTRNVDAVRCRHAALKYGRY